MGANELAVRVLVCYAGRLMPATLVHFFIGAHAAVAGLRLLTRDPSRYRTRFPSLELVAPT